MVYKYDKHTSSVRDEQGSQVLLLMCCSCSHKFKHMAGKLLVEKLNTIERSKSLKGRSHAHPDT